MTLHKLLTNIYELTHVSVFVWSGNRSINLIASGSALDLFKTLSTYLLECDVTAISENENHVMCTLKAFIDRVE